MKKQILREMGKIYRTLNSFTDFLVKPMQLEKGQYQFLVRIDEHPGLNQQSLSDLLLVDKTTTAKAVNKLVEKGYITKQRSEKDKRNFKLFLTERGESICSFLRKEEQFAIHTALNHVSNQEAEQLLEQMVEINKNIHHLYQGIKENSKEDYIKLIQEGFEDS